MLTYEEMQQELEGCSDSELRTKCKEYAKQDLEEGFLAVRYVWEKKTPYEAATMVNNRHFCTVQVRRELSEKLFDAYRGQMRKVICGSHEEAALNMIETLLHLTYSFPMERTVEVWRQIGENKSAVISERCAKQLSACFESRDFPAVVLYPKNLYAIYKVCSQKNQKWFLRMTEISLKNACQSEKCVLNYKKVKIMAEENPDLMKEYRQYLELLLEKDLSQEAGRFIERLDDYYKYEETPFGYTREEWKRLFCASDVTRLIEAYFRCENSGGRTYTVQQLEEDVYSVESGEFARCWVKILRVFSELKELLDKSEEEFKNGLEVLKDCEMFSMDTQLYYIPIAIVQAGIINTLIERESPCLMEYFRAVGDKNVYLFKYRKVIKGHMELDEVKMDYETRIKPRLLALKNKEELVELYMNSHLRYYIDINDVVRNCAKYSPKGNVYNLFKDYEIAGKITRVENRGYKMMVQPSPLVAYIVRGKSGEESFSGEVMGQAEINRNWQYANMKKLDYAKLGDYCVYKYERVRDHVIIVTDVVIKNEKHEPFSQEESDERRQKFLEVVYKWLDKVEETGESIEFLGNEGDGFFDYDAPVRCACPSYLADTPQMLYVREKLAERIVEVVAGLKGRTIDAVLAQLTKMFLKEVDECRFIPSQSKANMGSIKNPEIRENIRACAKRFLNREDVLVEQKFLVFFNTAMKLVCPVESLATLGDAKLCEYVQNHGIEEYTIPVRFDGMRKCFVQTWKNYKEYLPYYTEYRFEYEGEKDFDPRAQWFAGVGKILPKERTIVLNNIWDKDAVKGEVQEYLRLFYDLRRAQSYEIGLERFGENKPKRKIGFGSSTVRYVREFTDTIRGIFEKQRYCAEECLWLLEYMEQDVNNNPYTCSEGKPWVQEAFDVDNSLHSIVEKAWKGMLTALTEQKEAISTIKAVYEKSFFAYYISEERFAQDLADIGYKI